MDQIIDNFPEFEFIKSSSIDVPNTEIDKIYSKCFLGLRLTTNDNNANTAIEMGKMKIPIIHNGEYFNCIPWNNINDIKHIFLFSKTLLF